MDLVFYPLGALARTPLGITNSLYKFYVGDCYDCILCVDPLLHSEPAHPRWDMPVEQVVQVLSCARIWFVGDSIQRNLFFVITNLLNEKLSKRAFMYPSSIRFEWSYSTIMV